MVELSMVLDILTTVSIIIGVFYYIMTLQNSNNNQQLSLKAQQQSAETRQAQLFMYMYEKVSSPEFSKHWYIIRLWEFTDYDDLMERDGDKKNPDLYLSFSTVGKYFEGIGILVKRGLIDVSLVDDMMSGYILNFWEQFGESFIKIMRVRQPFPAAYEWVEYLYNEVAAIAHKQHPELKT